MATNDIGRVTPIWRGFYSAATTYELNDIVIDTAGSVWWHKSEELTTGVIPEAGEIWDAVIDMSIFSGLIQAAITTAQTALAAAQAALAEITADTERAETAADNAENSAAAASESAAGVGALAQAAERSAEAAAGSATGAAGSAQAAAGSKSDAEAYAVGTRGGEDVGSTDPTYHNNAKYYAEQAASEAEAAAQSAEDAQDVLDSIPEDYSQLSADVGDLKTHLTEITGNTLLEPFLNGYIATNGSTADIDSVTIGDGTWKNIVVDCNQGDIFTVCGKGGSKPILYAFLGAESDGTRPVFSAPKASSMAEGIFVITAPEGAEKLVVNTKNNVTYYLCTNKAVRTAFDEIVMLDAKIDAETTRATAEETKTRTALTDITGSEYYYDFRTGRYINTSEDYISILTLVSNAAFNCKIVDCAENDVFTITGKGGSAVSLLYVFLGAETEIEGQTVRPALLKSDTYEEAADKFITAPAGSEKLVVNVRNDRTYYLCKGRMTKKLLSDLTQDVNTEVGYLRVGNPLIGDQSGENGYFVSANESYFGQIRPAEGSFATDYVEVVPGSVLRIGNVYLASNRAVIAYDSDKKPLKPALATAYDSVKPVDITVTVPQLARYIRMTGKTSEGACTCEYLSVTRDGHEANYSLICDTATDGKYVSSSSGSTPSAENSCYTDFVRVRPYAHVIINNLYLSGNRSVYCYGKNKGDSKIRSLISDSSAESFEFDVTPDIYYIRATGHAGTAPEIYMSDPTVADTERMYKDVNILISSDFGYYTQDKIVTYVDDDAINLTGLGLLEAACDDLTVTNGYSVRCSISAITKLLVAPREDRQDRIDLLKRLESKGFHICNHTNDHSRWFMDYDGESMFTLAEVEEDLIKSIRILDELGFIDASRYFVYPGSSQVREGIPQILRKWTELAATISDGNNIPGNNIPYWLYRCHISGNDESHTVEYYANQLAELEKAGQNWIIYYAHCKNYTPDPETGRSEWSATLFKGVMQNAIDHGYKVMTLNEAWKYRRGGYMIQEAFGV